MGKYVRQRLVGLGVVVFIASVIVFSLIRFLPGDPARVIAGDTATPEQVEAIRLNLGLDRSVLVQYWIWITRVLRGDFGTSFANGISVSELISQRLPATLELAV